MTPAAFRKLALSLPDTVEGSHMGHTDFRFGGRVFASLPGPGALRGEPEASVGMVRLSPEQQARVIADDPGAFVSAQGAWGRAGCTYVRLREVDRAAAKHALELAWTNLAAAMQRPARSRKGKPTHDEPPS